MVYWTTCPWGSARGGTMYGFCPRIVVSWHLRRPRTRFRTCFQTRFRFQPFPEPCRNLVSVFLLIFCFFPSFFQFFPPCFLVFSPLFFQLFPGFSCFSLTNYVSCIVSFPFSRQKLTSNSVSFPISRRKLASNSVSFPISRRKLASNRLVFKKLVSPTPRLSSTSWHQRNVHYSFSDKMFWQLWIAVLRRRKSMVSV